jgi:hypothetical protein
MSEEHARGNNLRLDVFCVLLERSLRFAPGGAGRSAPVMNTPPVWSQSIHRLFIASCYGVYRLRRRSRD